jgi:hypothetical protein
MAETFGSPVSSYNPPPEKKSNTTTIIIIVVVVLLLLCCCCAIGGYLLYTYGDQIFYTDTYSLLSSAVSLI